MLAFAVLPCSDASFLLFPVDIGRCLNDDAVVTYNYNYLIYFKFRYNYLGQGILHSVFINEYY